MISYRALAVAVIGAASGLALAAAGCSSSSSSTPYVPSFAVSEGNADARITIFRDPRTASQTASIVVNSGSNQGIVHDISREITYHAGVDAGTGGPTQPQILVLSSPNQILLGATTTALRTITSTAFVRPRGLALDPFKDILYVADNGTSTSTANILVYRNAHTATASAVPEVITLPLVGTTAAQSNRPWDCSIDVVNDRLYIAISNTNAGFVLIGASTSTTVTAASANRGIELRLLNTVTTTANEHGIVFDPLSDRVIISDVGNATAGTNDGAVYVLHNIAAQVATASAKIDFDLNAAPSIKITSGGILDNPVDVECDFATGDILIAEKASATNKGVLAIRETTTSRALLSTDILRKFAPFGSGGPESCSIEQ